MEVNDKMKLYLESEVGKAALMLMAYTIKTTPTDKDDEIIANVDEIVDILADSISKINNLDVTIKEAKEAAFIIIKTIAEATPNKWDDRALPIIDMFL